MNRRLTPRDIELWVKSCVNNWKRRQCGGVMDREDTLHGHPLTPGSYWRAVGGTKVQYVGRCDHPSLPLVFYSPLDETLTLFPIGNDSHNKVYGISGPWPEPLVCAVFRHRVEGHMKVPAMSEEMDPDLWECLGCVTIDPDRIKNNREN